MVTDELVELENCAVDFALSCVVATKVHMLLRSFCSVNMDA